MLQGVSTNDIFEKLRHGRFPKPVLHPWGWNSPYLLGWLVELLAMVNWCSFYRHGTASTLSYSSDRGVVRYILYLIEQYIHPCVLILPIALVSVAPTSRD
jgi:hypothetical protein